MQNAQEPGRVRETFFYFLRLGCLGFGGPLALVANIQKDLVIKRRWISEAEFSQTFALIKAMPGPVAFMTSVFMGRRHAGWRGGVVAAFALNFPPFLLMVLFGIFYDRWRAYTGAQSFMNGMQAAALGVILASLKSLGFSHRKKAAFWLIAAIAAFGTFHNAAYEPFLIIGFGALTALIFQLRENGKLPSYFRHLKLMIFPMGLGTLFLGQFDWGKMGDLIWSCFKSGAFVFGSGLAIVPLMENDFVSRLHWLTHQEFMDALAFGQITPGPVVITATFIGYKVLGLAGAIAGTLAIFAAAFFHMMTWFPRLVSRMQGWPWIPAFLTGAIGAVVGSIFATVIRLSLEWTHDPRQWIVQYSLIGLTLVASIWTRLPAWSLIPVGGILTWCLSTFFF